MHPRLLPIFDPLPISFVQGQNAWLWDEAGNRYLDAASGVGVNLLGYDHPIWTKALQEQVRKPIHLSNMFRIPEQEHFAEVLCTQTSMDKVFFGNSGADANECAIKLARLYGHSLGIESPTLIVFDRAFHGRTLATLTASGLRHLQAGFEPLVSGFARAPFGDIEAVRQISDARHDIVGVLFEPIQGYGGVHVAPDPFLHALRDLCHQKKWLFIADEIQTGMGRTGAFLYLDHLKIQADIITLAKGLANGIPIGACLTRGVANDLLGLGSHGATFGGNPLGCSMGNKALEILHQENIIKNVDLLGATLLAMLKTALEDKPYIKAIRGKGFMIGIELDKPCQDISQLALSYGLLLNVTNNNVIRLLPPLVLQAHELEILTEKLVTVLNAFYKK